MAVLNDVPSIETYSSELIFKRMSYLNINLFINIIENRLT